MRRALIAALVALAVLPGVALSDVPAPQPVQSLADDAAAWLATFGLGPGQRATISVGAMADGLARSGAVAEAWPGRRIVVTPAIDSELLDAAEGRAVDHDAQRIELHEELHETNDHLAGSASWTPADRAVEEGTVDAVAVDLTAPWTAHEFGVPMTSSPGYPGQVAWIRLASARAVHARWQSPAARRWRRALLIASTAGRRAMLGSLDGIPLVPSPTS